jgi:hypothetical protein
MAAADRLGGIPPLACAALTGGSARGALHRARLLPGHEPVQSGGMSSANDLEALIRHAEAYPYERPAGSYLYDDGAVRPFGRPRLAGRVPVIAAGSNAAPAQLAAKFGQASARIPVTRARLQDHAVVYAAHFAIYGALPATLHPVAGAESEVFVTWLTPAQLVRMHLTEGVGSRYDYAELAGLTLEVDGIGTIDAAGAYIGRHGALVEGAGPVRLAAVPARGCALPPAAQPAMLRAAHARLAAGWPYRRFMGQILRSLRYRTRASAILARSALPWALRPAPAPAGR